VKRNNGHRIPYLRRIFNDTVQVKKERKSDDKKKQQQHPINDTSMVKSNASNLEEVV